MIMIKCPRCGFNIGPVVAANAGRASSPAKAEAARENARKGGWPKFEKGDVLVPQRLLLPGRRCLLAHPQGGGFQYVIRPEQAETLRLVTDAERRANLCCRLFVAVVYLTPHEQRPGGRPI